MPKRNFKDKTVVITGGASGIGLATALRFARAGARLGLIDADGDGLARCVGDFRRRGTPVENAAEAIFRSAERERAMLVLTPVGKLGFFLSRFAPGFYERQMTRRLKSELEY